MPGTIHWSGAGSSGSIPINHYPSGEPVLNFDSKQDVGRLLVRPTSMLDFMAVLFFVDALVERGQSAYFASAPHLTLPFVPGARQDRMNSAGDYLFTAKSIAKEINLRCFRSVTILDPHSEVISGMIDRCHIIHADNCVYEGIEHFAPHYVAVVSPDAGAEKRAGAVAKKLGLPLLHGWKSRDVKDGKITGFGLEPTPTTGTVLVVDDICDGGGTFIGLGAVIKERGLKAHLYVTHGIFSQGTQKLRDHYEKIVCTDSIEGDKPGVEIIPICKRNFEGTL